MENFDSSWISLSADETDLMSVDPVAAAQALKRAINRLTDDEVGAMAMRAGLNIRSDAMILRNRLDTKCDVILAPTPRHGIQHETSRRKSRKLFKVRRRLVGILLKIFRRIGFRSRQLLTGRIQFQGQFRWRCRRKLLDRWCRSSW